MNTLEPLQIYNSLSGGSELLKWFGRVPSFHDAEIVEISLQTKGTSKLSFHTWNMTDKVKPDGYFEIEKHAVVTFELASILDLKLEGFNHQNVVWGVELKRAIFDPNPYVQDNEFETYKLIIEPCYGMSGYIQVRELSVSFKPGQP